MNNIYCKDKRMAQACELLDINAFKTFLDFETTWVKVDGSRNFLGFLKKQKMSTTEALCQLHNDLKNELHSNSSVKTPQELASCEKKSAFYEIALFEARLYEKQISDAIIQRRNSFKNAGAADPDYGLHGQGLEPGHDLPSHCLEPGDDIPDTLPVPRSTHTTPSRDIGVR
jgi:hypothetical protein